MTTQTTRYIENTKEIEERLDPAAVIDLIGYSKSRPQISGVELRTACPIHKGSGPNLSINVKTHMWLCQSHGCKGGGLIDLYMQSTGKPYTEAVENLANHSAIPVKYKQPCNGSSMSKPEAIYSKSKRNEDDPYFKAKGIKPPSGVRYNTRKDGKSNSIVPVYNANEQLQTLQFIPDPATKEVKRFLKDSPAKGGYFPLGTIRDSGAVMFAEGVATAATAWEALGESTPVIATLSSGNMVEVIEALQEKYQGIKPVILIDNDDAGLSAAAKVAARFSDAEFRLPHFEQCDLSKWSNFKPPKDFNDLMQIAGWDEVMRQLKEPNPRENLPTNEKAVSNPYGAFPSEARQTHHATQAKLSETRTNASASNTFAHLLEPYSEEDMKEELSRISPGLSVGYKIGDFVLKLPGGAITVVAGPTSHGKTAVLINFALQALNYNSDKSVYFFSYEEGRGAIATLFLNTFLAKDYSRNNREFIKEYFRSGKLDYPSREDRVQFVEDKNAFFNTLINTKRLNVHYSEMPIEELVLAIRYLKANTNVGLVCIDYIQLLVLSLYSKAPRHEQLKSICLHLKNVAIDTGLPILVASQFNRQVLCQGDLSPTNIGEAGDIERAASLIIGMWNRNFEGFSRDGNKDKQGNPIAKENTIYLEVLKGRGVGAGHSCVMDFHGNTGKLMERANEKIGALAQTFNPGDYMGIGKKKVAK